MPKLILILVVALIFEAVGVVYLSKGLKQIGSPEKITAAAVLRLVGSGVTNANVLLGVFFEAMFFGGLLILMSKGDVSFVWPLTSLGFVLTTLAAKIFLHEHVSGLRWMGVLLIMAGAFLITYTESIKPSSVGPVVSTQNESPPAP
ncbi:MAG: EamA family transporter [Verrucomicrobiota bacterium]